MTTIQTKYYPAKYGLGTEYSVSEMPLEYMYKFTNRFINIRGDAEKRQGITALGSAISGMPVITGLHEYVSPTGTTTLFAALNMLDGTVIGKCMPRHRSREFIRFLQHIDEQTPAGLDLHLIVDNYGTHKSPPVKRWLKKHRRFHLHFIPTSSSWLNMIERWFREITQNRIRRGIFRSVPDLITAIQDYLTAHNEDPKIFTWTKDAETILAKVQKARDCNVINESVH